ncbi:MAG: alpha/beta fold hydrolase [Pseudomonadota bacterium]|nr:alpha/beta fold hydrolase [Pseudomonadota bacterium]
MSGFIPWSSQPIEHWAKLHATGRFVELDGHRTHFIEKGEGEPIILMHGFFYDSQMWAANIDDLAQHFRVYALDLWGSGYSTRAPLDYGYPLFARQLELFMDHLGISRASLVGQSMGAGTAIAFANRHRERVERLLLVAAAGLPNPIPLLARFLNLPGVGEFLLSLKTDAIRRGALTDAFIHDRRRITPAYFDDVTRAHKVAGSLEAGLAMTRAGFFGSLSDDIARLGELDVPTQLVWGRHDKAVGLHLGETMQRMLPGSRLQVLEDAGHVPNFEQAKLFNRLAIEFLASPPVRSEAQREELAGLPVA